MKMLGKIISTSALAFLLIIPSQAQKGEKQVQIKIIENGKVKTDTSFTVTESVNKKDIEKLSKILNHDDLYFLEKDHPGKQEFVYRYEFNDMSKMKMMDSLMENQQKMFMMQDSAFQHFQRHFKSDSVFMHHPGLEFFDAERDMPDDFFYAPHRFRHHSPMQHIEKDIIIDDNEDMVEAPEGEQKDVIIEKKGPGEEKITIKKSGKPSKIIRKRIDDDTEIIIIKKDSKKSKPE